MSCWAAFTTEVRVAPSSGLERAGRARRAVDALQLVVQLGLNIGIAGAGRLVAQLRLHELVKHPVDGGNQYAGAVGAGSNLDDIRCLAHIVRRIRIGNIAGDQRQTGLRRDQSR